MVLSARQAAQRRGAVEPPRAAAPAAPLPPRPKRGGEPEGPEVVLMHPDATEASPINAAYVASVGGVEKRVIVEGGRVETRDPALAAYLVRLGYRQMNVRLEVSDDPAWAATKARLREQA